MNEDRGLDIEEALSRIFDKLEDLDINSRDILNHLGCINDYLADPVGQYLLAIKDLLGDLKSSKVKETSSGEKKRKATKSSKKQSYQDFLDSDQEEWERKSKGKKRGPKPKAAKKTAPKKEVAKKRGRPKNKS